MDFLFFFFFSFSDLIWFIESSKFLIFLNAFFKVCIYFYFGMCGVFICLPHRISPSLPFLTAENDELNVAV